MAESFPDRFVTTRSAEFLDATVTNRNLAENVGFFSVLSKRLFSLFPRLRHPILRSGKYPLKHWAWPQDLHTPFEISNWVQANPDV